MTFATLKKVVILGASGFIGSNIYQHLKRVKNLDIAGYSSRECDLLDCGRVSEVVGSATPETSIVLCSAITRRREDSWEAMLRNITMIHNFVSGLPDNGIRSIIFLSSADIYGLPPASLPVREDTAINPLGYYGLAKFVGETLLKSAPTRPQYVTILRLPGVYGPGDGSQSIVGRFIRQISRHETIELFGDGNIRRDYVEIGDLCRVVEHFLNHPCDGVVNVATGSSVPIKELVTIAAAALGIKPVIKFLPAAGAQISDLVFDITRLKALCPSLVFKSLEQGIEEYVSHLRGGDLPG